MNSPASTRSCLQNSRTAERRDKNATSHVNLIRRNIRPIALVMPLALFFAVGALITHQDSEGNIDPSRYLILVIVRVVSIAAILVLFWRLYVADFPLKIDRWGWIVGLLGGLLWIAVCELHLERAIVSSLGLPASILGARSGLDPFAAYPTAGTRHLFLAFRFSLLVIIVPIAEELFLRGFLMRIVDTDQWTSQPLSQIGRLGLLTGTVYGVFTHPSEFVAAAIWFSLVTVLMVRTGRFWNCVLAHALTNLILGIYLCYTGSWYFW